MAIWIIGAMLFLLGLAAEVITRKLERYNCRLREEINSIDFLVHNNARLREEVEVLEAEVDLLRKEHGQLASKRRGSNNEAKS